LVGLGIGVTCEATISLALPSTVASMFGVGSTGAGAALEQASAKVPISAARTTVSFIRLVCNYLAIPINHHTTTFFKLPGILHQQP
jgi:hypothetical protein